MTRANGVSEHAKISIFATPLGLAIYDAEGLDHSQAWQSHHGLHELDEFTELFEYVSDSANTVLEFLKIGYRKFEVWVANY